MDLGKIDAEMKKGIDARTKEFREKLTKLTYEKIKAKLKPSTHPLKGYPHNESIDEARKMPKNPAIDNDPKVKAARKDHAAGIWDGNVDKEGEAIVFVKGKPYTVTNKYEEMEEKTTCPKCEGKGCDHCDNTGYHIDESVDIDEAKKLGSRVKITKGRFAGKSGIIRQMDNGRFKGDAKSFDIDLDDGKEANGVTGKDIKIVKESAGDAVQGLNDLGNKMKGRDQKDIRRIEKLYRSGNNKVFQGAIRALDTDLRDQVKDIFDALGMVKNGVIESVDLDEGFSPKDIKMAIGVASDKRYAGGNMSGAVKAIEKIKKGLSDHPQVSAVLKRQNESKKLSKVSDMTERAMTLKQLASKYKGDIAKAQKSGNADSLKKAEKELTTWAMSNNEIGNAKEADDWLSNVVADKDQFAALLKFSNS